MVLEQNLHLPVVLIVFIIVIWFLRDILVNETKLLERIQKIEISIVLLTLTDHRIEFLEKEPDKVSIRFVIYVLQNWFACILHYLLLCEGLGLIDLILLYRSLFMEHLKCLVTVGSWAHSAGILVDVGLESVTIVVRVLAQAWLVQIKCSCLRCGNASCLRSVRWSHFIELLLVSNTRNGAVLSLQGVEVSLKKGLSSMSAFVLFLKEFAAIAAHQPLISENSLGLFELYVLLFDLILLLLQELLLVPMKCFKRFLVHCFAAFRTLWTVLTLSNIWAKSALFHFFSPNLLVALPLQLSHLHLSLFLVIHDTMNGLIVDRFQLLLILSIHCSSRISIPILAVQFLTLEARIV